MHLLVTAGGTVVPIDRVRCVATRFTGRTGARIALHAHARGHRVTLLTSHPAAVEGLGTPIPRDARWAVKPYHTFDQLHHLMAEELTAPDYDAVIHSAAVSDYRVAGVFAPDVGTEFKNGAWSGAAPSMIDRAAGKVKSDEPELWLRLTRTPKLIDLVRSEWKFAGVVVKFKLEVDVDDARLLEIAERSRVHSGSDLMVANTLDGAAAVAFVGPVDGKYERVPRPELAARLIAAVEQLHRERAHG